MTRAARRAEIERTLRAMGSTPVAPPDDSTVSRIEARWRAQPGGGRHRWLTLDPTLPSPHRRPLLVTAAGLAAAASVALAVMVATRRPGDGEVVVAEAEDIVIVLPGGEFVDPEPGKTIPEGAFVQAGPYAAGRIGGSDVRPDDLFVVRDGHLQRADVEQFTAASPQSSLTPTPPLDDHSASNDDAGGSADDGSVSRTTPARSGSTTPATRSPVPSTAPPTAAEPSTTAAAVATSAPTTAAASAAPTTSPATVPAAPTTVGAVSEPTSRPLPARLRVSARLEAGNVVVTWSPYTGDGFRRYAVFRVRSWGGGRPGGGRIASIGEGSVSSYVDASPQAGTYYVVLALGQANQVLALGGVKSPVTGAVEAAGTPVEPVTVEPVTVEPVTVEPVASGPSTPAAA